MKTIKRYFNLNERYKFDLMDIIAVANLICVILTICKVPYINIIFFCVASVGLINAFLTHRINLVILNLAFFILDLYYLMV